MELLVVIAIIGVLVGLLMPAAFSSVLLTGCGPDNGTTVMEPTDELRDLPEK
ncbi:secreted protein [Rhodopirellula maiorica SM1]|uniref:Secreted protein n=1 Tax=Rhodopirellula maiorica SM1 TaxID=1265738 RepID=M5RP88_9BACT|nr:secreted protein [Rhodopirellula maiorica SM1]